MCQNFSFRFAKSVAILTLILSYISLSNLYAQWEIINDGSDLKGFLNTIDFVNENVGWIAGSNGTLLKTTDDGENWNSIPINDSWNINQIDFFNELIGWGIGVVRVSTTWTYYIWKTTTGGSNWMSQFSSTIFGFSSLYVIDENNVFAVGSKIYKTTNGGTNWIDISPNLPNRNYNSIWFQNSQTGVVVGNYDDGTIEKGTILKTTNGGTNWTETIVNEFNAIYELQFLDESNGYFRAYKDSTYYICKTNNLFSNWDIVTQHPYPIISYQYLDNSTVYAIMKDSTSANPYVNTHNIKKSTDGGHNWNIVKSVKNIRSLNKIYITQFFGLFWGNYYGERGVGPTFIYRSTDFNNWIIRKFCYDLYNACFWNKNEGIFIGTNLAHHFIDGFNFMTNDGGISIDINYNAPKLLLKSCQITDASTAFALSWWYKIYRTNDKGNTWINVNFDSLGFSFWSSDISFLNEQTGFIVGLYQDSISSCAGILVSTNSGGNWELEATFANSGWLHSINLKDNTGCSVGDDGMIIRYTPQTGWVQQPSVTDLPLNKVFFSDDNHGWIAGGYQSENDFHPILLKTTNGGVNWITVPNIHYLFRDIAFIDNNLGWGIGYTQAGVGGILKTTDGGLTWEINTGNLPAKLNALHIKDNYGWAVGDAGLILRTTDAGAVWVEDESDNSLPAEFVLEQNFPNPFNPGTVIGYRLPVISKVTLKVFDVLGREVATLVNEEQPAGKYKVEFHPASRIKYQASGVYFYQLTAGSYSSTKKMLLLK